MEQQQENSFIQPTTQSHLHERNEFNSIDPRKKKIGTTRKIQSIAAKPKRSPIFKTLSKKFQEKKKKLIEKVFNFISLEPHLKSHSKIVSMVIYILWKVA